MHQADKPWKRILQSAKTRWPGVYSATCSANRFISVVDQQTRCFNLCYALHASTKVKPHSHVAVIGCGISGMTCAVAIAMLCDCIVYVFERDDRLLPRYRQAGFRFIHPDLTSHTNPEMIYETDKGTTFPPMNWTANYAPYVADELTRKFHYYRANLNIALYLNMDAESFEPTKSDSGETFVNINFRRLPRDNNIRFRRFAHVGSSFSFDVVIVATGFGDERASSYTNDSSYWRSGNPTYYQAARRRGSPRERVLISGAGDSGIVELAHYLLSADTGHQHIMEFMPVNSRTMPWLAGAFHQGVKSLLFKQIEEGDEHYPDVHGPVSWYWSVFAGKRAIDTSTKFGRLQMAIFNKINFWLSSHRPDLALEYPLGLGRLAELSGM
jgi:hypothetical protein